VSDFICIMMHMQVHGEHLVGLLAALDKDLICKDSKVKYVRLMRGDLLSMCFAGIVLSLQSKGM
jgi:hypothetical protein